MSQKGEVSKNKSFLIMVVEDQKDQSRMLLYILKAHDYRVVCAADGLKALELMKSGITPDLLITDINMPGLNGIELIREVKQLNMDVPIVVMSGSQTPKYLETFPNLVVEDYLVKPFLATNLLSRVEKILKKRSPQPLSAVQN